MKKSIADMTEEEIFQDLLVKCGIAPAPPPPPPKPAAIKAGERWAAPKPLSAVLQDAQRAEAQATERLRREREERGEEIEVVGLTLDGKTEVKRKMGLQDYQRQVRQAQIDAAWQRTLDYQRELAQWGGCHRGPGDPDW